MESLTALICSSTPRILFCLTWIAALKSAMLGARCCASLVSVAICMHTSGDSCRMSELCCCIVPLLRVAMCMHTLGDSCRVWKAVLLLLYDQTGNLHIT